MAGGRRWHVVFGLSLGGALLVAGGLAGGVWLARGPAEGSPPVDRLLQQAHVLLDRGDHRAARSLYEDVLAREPSSVEALTHMGNIAYAQKAVERALDFYRRALSIDADDPHALYDQGVALRWGAKDLAGAVAAWRRFLEVMPEGADADRVRSWIEEAERAASTPGPSLRPAVPSPRSTLSPERVTGKAAFSYRLAREIPQVLAQLPCYCGCQASFAHANLLDCYVDDHAASCPVCQESTQVASEMVKAGYDVETIAARITTAYGTN